MRSALWLLVALAPLGIEAAALAADTPEHPAPGAVATKAKPPGPIIERRVMSMRWRDRSYRIQVAAPHGEAPPEGYPVFYTTDGNGLFDLAAQTAFIEAAYQDYTSMPPVVVVAIGYESAHPFDPMRAYDLSPPDPAPPKDAKVMNNEAVAGVGGADHFLDFIGQSLKPAIEQQYKIDRHRQALFGHSRGGLFVLHTLFTRPREFQIYIAASPAIWWHDRFVVKERRQFLASLPQRPTNARLLITVGALEQGSDMVDNAFEMSQALTGLQGKGLEVSYFAFDQEDHISVIPAAISRALNFAFKNAAGKHAGPK